MKFDFMKNHTDLFSVNRMSQVLGVSTSGYYKYASKAPSKRERENTRLLLEIKKIHKETRETYGYPRMHIELQSRGVACGRNRVARLMRQHGIVAKMVKKFRVKSRPKQRVVKVENLLDQNFVAVEPNQKWVSDITYVPTKQGWLYLAVVLDLYSRKVVGMSMSKFITKELVLGALNQATMNRKIRNGLVCHSDKGSQYTSADFQSFLKVRGITSSMSGKGNCYDNAVAESFFHTIKTELTRFSKYETRQEAKNDIFEYVQIFYNKKRRHSYLGYLSPDEFEARLDARNCVSTISG